MKHITQSMKHLLIPTAALAASTLLPCNAFGVIDISMSRINNVSDDDSVSTGDALDSYEHLTSTSATITTIDGSAELGGRFYGANSGRGEWNLNQQVRTITQTISLSIEWAIEATEGETYSFTFDPELHALLNILDDNNGESGDLASISTLEATLWHNMETVADTLDLSGGSRSTAGSSTVNDTATQTFDNLTGTNVFRLVYTGSIVASWKIASFADNRTANAVLWGSDGTMDGGHYSDSFDEYSQEAQRLADGILLNATATNTTPVPEPAAFAGLLGLAALLVTRRRA